ncbi:MAG: hypothetical protein M0R80_13395 [Proteobacteria bacterium]|jgi:hypothetical protein|nr:hypothetical protein [Pseudomonadota bacterium]
MRTFKYIIFENGFRIFGTAENHKDVADGRKVLAAGMIDLDEPICYGNSESLGVKSRREEDTKEIKFSGDPSAQITNRELNIIGILSKELAPELFQRVMNRIDDLGDW